jgi:hypothetical protein
MDESWTIAELAELAAEALAGPGTPDSDAVLDSGPDSAPVRANGRVRDVPNERLIRWYGTVGLVDPPLSRRGRVARYGRRHLLQLVAVKRRQAEGKSLAEIQAELAGAPDDALAAVARVPLLESMAAQAGGSGLPAVTPSGPGRFWAREPRRLAVAASPAGPDQDGADVPTAGLVRGIRLAPGVLLLLDGADQEPSPQDITAIMSAAELLLTELASRGLGAASTHHPAEIDDLETGAGDEH